MKHLLAIFAIGAVLAAPAQAAEFYGVVVASHTSDVFSGMSDFTPTNPEPTTDFIGGGVSVVFKKAGVEIDIVQGFKSRDCGAFAGSHNANGCKWESGTNVTLRWYPGRRRASR